MANNPYSGPTLTGYNATPPVDDGTQVASNQLNWAKHKDKLGDPLKTFAEAIDTAVAAAFAKIINTDADENNLMNGSLAFGSSEKTIAESVGVGSITATRTHHTVDTEVDASADDLDVINTASVSDGAILILRAENAGRVVTVKHEGASGNIHLADNLDFVLDDLEKSVVLQRRGTDWHELAQPHRTKAAFENRLLHVQDEKAQNTAGGTFTSGAWRTRDLNTAKTNEITGASLSANQVSLPAGTYYAEWSAPCLSSSIAEVSHQTRLQDTTGAATLLNGTSESQRAVASEHAQTRSIGRGRFTISVTSLIELQHQIGTTTSTNGFGEAANFTTEVYSILEIWEVAP